MLWIFHTPYTFCPDQYSRSQLFSQNNMVKDDQFFYKVWTPSDSTIITHVLQASQMCSTLCEVQTGKPHHVQWHTWTSGLEEWHIHRKTTKQSFSKGPQTSVEWSTLSSLGKISQVQKSTPYLCRGLYHSSRHPADVWTLGTSQYMVRFTTR